MAKPHPISGVDICIRGFVLRHTGSRSTSGEANVDPAAAGSHRPAEGHRAITCSSPSVDGGWWRLRVAINTSIEWHDVVISQHALFNLMSETSLSRIELRFQSYLVVTYNYHIESTGGAQVECKCCSLNHVSPRSTPKSSKTMRPMHHTRGSLQLTLLSFVTKAIPVPLMKQCAYSAEERFAIVV